MDLVAGGSMQTLLDDHGPLPESYVAVLLDQTLQALHAVHSAGVVHRDVKPANLLLEPTGTRRPHVRLSDFGVAAVVDDVRLTRFPGAIGTDGYMPPEQADGAPPDPRQDLYAAGVVAIQLLTGLEPRDQHGPPPGRLAPLLTALTEPEPGRRVATARDALASLRQLGVPSDAPWLQQPEPPEVVDQLGELDPPAGVPAPVPAHSSGTGPGADAALARTAGGPGSGRIDTGSGSGAAVPRALPAEHTPGTTSAAMTIATVVCFVVAVALAAAALWLIL
jgi:serine/threonine protein kinase